MSINGVLKKIIWVIVSFIAALSLSVTAGFLNPGEKVNAVWLVVATICIFVITYRFYAAFISSKVLAFDESNRMPSETEHDGIDYYPMNKWVLLGHHFAAIAGAGPLIGPTLAAQFGFLPGFLWILVGATLAGAVHDMVILAASARHKGRSLAQIVREEIGTVSGFVLALIIIFNVIVAVAGAALAVVNSLNLNSWGTFTLLLTFPIALFMGLYMRFLRHDKIIEVSIIGALLLLVAVFLGSRIPGSSIAHIFTIDKTRLIIYLGILCFISSALPIWLLLVPRDYISAYLKVGTFLLLAVTIMINMPVLEMPKMTTYVAGGGPIIPGTLFPFLFITIACGAISGFHGLISSGTTPKMIKSERDIPLIGFGSMLIEGFVAVIALIAASILIPGDYFAINTNFSPEMLSSIGFPIDRIKELSQAIGLELQGRPGGAVSIAAGMSVLLSSLFGGKASLPYWYNYSLMFIALFILTLVDAGTRVGRFMLQEVAGTIYKPFSNHKNEINIMVTSLMIVIMWCYLLFTGNISTIWPMFGIANQILATTALGIGTTLMIKSDKVKYIWITVIPMLFMLITSYIAAWELVFIFFENASKSQNSANAFNLKMNAVLIIFIALLGIIVIGDLILKWYRLLNLPSPKLLLVKYRDIIKNKLIKRTSILAKLLTFLIATLIISFAVIYCIFSVSFSGYSDYVMKKSEVLLTDKYRYMLQSNTELAVSLVTAINKIEKLNPEEKFKLSQEIIRQLRFGSDGYYYAYEAGTGKNLIHGLDKKLEGKSLWDMQDPEGTQYIIRELDDVAKKKKMFHEFYWSKPGIEGIYPKLGTAMSIPGTNMWIGTGAYIDDINKSKSELRGTINKITANTRLNFLIGFLIIAPFSIMVIIFLSKNITNPIKHLITSTEAVSCGNYDVKIDTKTHDEIGKLAQTFNTMTVTLKDLTENLENKVTERTSELQETMNKLNEMNSILGSLSDKLSKYLSPQIRQMIFTGKNEGGIASTRKKLTVFFSDIKNFTQTTERMETESITDLLNNYLTEMSQIAIKHGATIDKFIGDAILLFFGDPESRGYKEDAVAALDMALEMKNRLRHLQVQWYESGITEPFHVRMGINTGYCTVGNFGSEARLSYTIIGSQVNLASRLESSAETDQILISHETYSLVSHKYYCLEKEEIMVKGIDHPIKTYQVIDTHENLKKKNKLIEERSSGFNICIDIDNLKTESRGKAKEVLTRALQMLENTDGEPLDEIITSAVEDIKKESRALNSEFLVNTDGTVFRGNTLILSEVLHDLLLNAVLLSGENGKIAVTSATDNNSTEIMVTDSGQWLEREEIKNLFAEEGDIKSVTGLSLYGVKMGVRELNGRISSKRNSEGGNIFILTIPV